MRPLQIVTPADLKPGKMYLIQEKRPQHADIKYKGTFIKNDYSQYYYQKIRRHFTNVVVSDNKPYIDLHLEDTYWNYYEADNHLLAAERA